MNLTKLDAVRAMLESVGLAHIDALETGQFTEAGDAERILDREHKAVLLEGHYGNRVVRTYTAASNKIELTNVLAVKAVPVAGQPLRNLTMRKVGSAYLLYDLDEDTSTITTGQTRTVLATDFIDFDNCPMDMQNVILQRAVQVYQQRRGGSQLKDQQNDANRIRSEAVAQRTAGPVGIDRSGPPPFAIEQPQNR